MGPSRRIAQVNATRTVYVAQAVHGTLLALRVNGADLTADHGFPARVVVPVLPGVHTTKWVARMTFQPAAASPP